MTQIVLASETCNSSHQRQFFSDIIYWQLVNLISLKMEHKCESQIAHNGKGDRSGGRLRKRRKGNKKANGRASSAEVPVQQAAATSCKVAAEADSKQLIASSHQTDNDNTKRSSSAENNQILKLKNANENVIVKPSQGHKDNSNCDTLKPKSENAKPINAIRKVKVNNKENSEHPVSENKSPIRAQSPLSTPQTLQNQNETPHSQPLLANSHNPIPRDVVNTQGESVHYMRHKQLVNKMKTIKQLINDTTEKATLAREEVRDMREKADTAFSQDDARGAIMHKMRVNVMRGTIREAQVTQQKFFEMYKNLREQVIANQANQIAERPNMSQSLRDVGRV